MSCRGPEDPHDTGTPRFPVEGDLVNPRYLYSSCPRMFLRSTAVGLLEKGSMCLNGTASEELGQRGRRETHLRIGGPDGPGGVVSSISTLLS